MAVEILTALRSLLKKRFGGQLRYGSHASKTVLARGGLDVSSRTEECCALELVAAYRNQSWTDDPCQVRTFDLRPLNDVIVPDAVRTEHLLPVLAAYYGSADWPAHLKAEVLDRILLFLTRNVIPDLPYWALRLSFCVWLEFTAVKTIDDAVRVAQKVGISDTSSVSDSFREVTVLRGVPGSEIKQSRALIRILAMSCTCYPTTVRAERYAAICAALVAAAATEETYHE